MRRIAVLALVLAAAAVVLVLASGAGGSNGSNGAYRVRAIFDSASFITTGSNVRVAGVNIGSVDSLDVTRDNKAAVVMNITDPGFQDFRRDAECTIRPQSLIGEFYVECTPTQPRAEGQPAPPRLQQIASGDGAGDYALPVQQTSSPVGVDLLGDTLRLPQRQKLTLIINELGAGLAGNGAELNRVIRRSNPALRDLNQVLNILVNQNRTLARLATDSDTAIAPLARSHKRITGFIRAANTVGRATAARGSDLQANFQKLPRFLAELRPTSARLSQFADQATPTLADLHAAAPGVNRLVPALGPFAQASRPAFRALGKAAQTGTPAMLALRPVARNLSSFATDALPLGRDLSALLTSLRKTGGIERFLDYTFYQATSVNGFDAVGHYLRAELVGPAITCGIMRVSPSASCWGNFGPTPTPAPTATATSVTPAPARLRGASAVPAAASAQAVAPSMGGATAAASAGGTASPSVNGSASPSANGAASPTSSGTASPSANGTAPAAADGPLLDYLFGGGSAR